jgi:hypothetical protein
MNEIDENKDEVSCDTSRKDINWRILYKKV